VSEIIKLDIDAMVERFRFLGKNLVPTVYTAMLVSANRMVRDVKLKRLSGPRGAPGKLGVVTGAAGRSMTDIVRFQNDTIAAILGSGLGYVKAHEEGLHGVQNVKAHVRRRLGVIKAVSIAQATRGKVIKRGAVTAAQKRKGAIAVKAHSRKANIIAKWFIRDMVREAKQPTERRIMNALMIAVKTGRVPAPNQIGA